MKKLLILLFSIISSACFSATMYSMDQSIKDQICTLTREKNKKMETFKPINPKEPRIFDPQYSEICSEWRKGLADIVRNSGSRISNKEKLDLLWGKSRFEDRKKIIKDMIEKEHVDPNTILYHHYLSFPLCEAMSNNDLSFFNYLLDHGAKPEIPKGYASWAIEYVQPDLDNFLCMHK